MASLFHPKYRSDIDGLRAVAILAVVIYHAFPDWLPGGFVGVDIFFVISGYLISTIVFQSIKDQTFSFREFYIRRIKRIFPALGIVMLACLGFGWIVLLPYEYEQLGRHAFGGAAFVANFILSSEAGYFNNSAETKPLLHLWSLSVEEQFYALFPVLWIFAWRLRIKLITLTVGLALVSFVLSVLYVISEPVPAFYWPHFRFWELLTGSVMAYCSVFGRESIKIHPAVLSWFSHVIPKIVLWRDASATKEVQSIAGAMLILIAVTCIDKEMLFPGGWALFPVVGAALLISAGQDKWINRTILSTRIMVWVGLISYPLYLWHYPLLSFAAILWGQTPPMAVRGGLVVLAFFLAWLTYVTIERPIRFHVKRGWPTVGLITLLFCAGLAGSAVQWNEGIATRSNAWLSVKNDGLIGNVDYFKVLFDSNYHFCEPLSVRKDSPTRGTLPRCLQSKPGTQVEIAILGDSHAEHLFPGLADTLIDKNVAYYVHGRGPPFKNIGEIDRLLSHMASETTLKTVIISSRWLSRVERISSDGNLYEEIRYLVEKLTDAGKQVYLVEGLPTFSFDPQSCKHARLWPFREHRCTESKANFQQQLDAYASAIYRISLDFKSIRLIRTSEFFCDRKGCFMAKDGQLYFRDRNHLSFEGSKYAARRIIEMFPELKGDNSKGN